MKLLCILFISVFLYSGSVEGPYVLWVNTSQNFEDVDLRIRNFLKHGNYQCWEYGAIFYMKNIPSEITTDLARSAMIDKSQPSIKRLNKILKKPHLEATKGLDGIILYTDVPVPKMFSLTTGQSRIKSSIVEGPNGLEDAFCKVMPPITRDP